MQLPAPTSVTTGPNGAGSALSIVGGLLNGLRMKAGLPAVLNPFGLGGGIRAAGGHTLKDQQPKQNSDDGSGDSKGGGNNSGGGGTTNNYYGSQDDNEEPAKPAAAPPTNPLDQTQDDIQDGVIPDPTAQAIQNAGNAQQDPVAPGDGSNYSGDFTGGEDSTAAMAEGGTVGSYDGGGALPDPDESVAPQSMAPNPGALDLGDPSQTPPAQPTPDNSGAGPVEQAPPDNSGAGPVVGQQEAPSRIISLLQGAGAMAKDAVMQAATGEDAATNPAQAYTGAIPETPYQQPQQPANPWDALPADAAETVKNLADKQGPEAGQAGLQRMRIEYQNRMGAAFHALNAGDRNAAARLATNAYSWLPDGYSANVTPSGQGFNLHIQDPTGQQNDIPLSDKAFTDLTNIRQIGQFDTILHKGGVAGAAQQLGQQLPAAPAAQAPKAKPNPGKVITILPGPRNHGAKPSYQLIGGDAAQPPSASDSLETRARRQAYGDPGMQAQQKYIDTSQEAEAGRASKEKQAQTRADATVKAADTRAKVAGENNTRTNATRQQIAAMSQAEKSALLSFKMSEAHRLAVQGDLTNARAAVDTALQAAGSYDRLTPDQKKVHDDILARINNPGSAAQAPPQGAPQPRQQAAPTQQKNTPPAPGMKQYQGKWYTREQYQQAFGR